MKRFSFKIGLFLAWCSFFSLRAQENAFHFDKLTIERGLSHNTVFDLIQDRHGFIWIATRDGLNRYDGYECKVFRQEPGDTTGFQGRYIQTLLEDSQGNIWVGTRKNGINIRLAENGTFINLDQDPLFAAVRGQWIGKIYEDRSGRIWIGTLGNGVLVSDPATRQTIHLQTGNSALQNNFVFDFAQDDMGVMWIATAGAGLHYIELATGWEVRQLDTELPDGANLESYQKYLHLDGQGYLWITTQGQGIYRLDLTSRSFRNYTYQPNANSLSYDIVMDIQSYGADQLLIATDGGGLDVMDRQTGSFTNYAFDTGRNGDLNSNALQRILVDRDENIWIATFNGGVNIYQPRRTWFETYAHTGARDNELSYKSVLSIYQDQDGQIWLGTDGGGLNRFDPQSERFTVYTYDPLTSGSISSNVVKTIYEDRQERLWLGFFAEGLGWLDRQTGAFQTVEYGSLQGANIWHITGGSDGRLWLGSLGGGLISMDPEADQFEVYLHTEDNPHSIAENDVMVVLEDSRQSLWVGTATQGLDRFDRARNHFVHYRHQPADSASLGGNEVRCLFEDRRGRLWIGTEDGGLSLHLGNGRFRTFTKADGLLSNAVMGITEDDKGYLWVSTFKGITRLAEDLHEMIHFDFHAGHRSNQFNQMAILTAQEGKVYFGGINNLTAIDPENVKENRLDPPVVLTEFRVFNRPVSPGQSFSRRVVLDRAIEDADRIRLTYRENTFSFAFAALDFSVHGDKAYAYKMEGFDEEWRYPAPDQRTATYTNLDPGNYTFRVRGTNAGGDWSEQEALVGLEITPPFWKTGWFLSILGLLFAGLVVLINRIIIIRREYRLKQQVLQAEQEILQLQNQNLETEVAAKNSKLMSIALQMAHKNEILVNIREKLLDIRKETTAKDTRLLRSLIRMVEAELQDEDFWDQFNVYFDQVNQHYISGLLEKHPNLTQNDLRICALTRINLSTKEMAAILNVSVRGVEKSRYRLKKRLDLTPEDDLVEYLRQFAGMEDDFQESLN